MKPDEKQLYKQIGKNIQRFRQERRLSQMELAEMIDVSQAYIGKIERGNRRVPLSTLIGIAKALQVPLDKLVNYSPEHKEEKLTAPEDIVKEVLRNYPPKTRVKILKQALDTLME